MSHRHTRSRHALVSHLFILTLFSIVPLLSTGCSWFGKPDTCSNSGQNSFNALLSSKWRTYCETYEQHLHGVSDYSLVDLAEFFGNHPDNQADIRSKLIRFNEYEKCFDEPKSRLELRSLQACIDDSSSQKADVNRAWDAKVDDWATIIEQDQRALAVKVKELMADTERLNTKADAAWNSKQALLKKEYVTEFENGVLQAIEKNKQIESQLKEFDQAVERARPNEALSAYIAERYSNRFEKLNEKQADIDSDITQLNNSLRYFQYTTIAPYRPCPASKARSRNLKKLESEARSILEAKLEKLKAKGKNVRLTTDISSDTQGNTDSQSISGVACVQRPDDAQIEGTTTQCSAYTFTLIRKKDVDEKTWEEWEIEQFEDPGLEASIDCRNL